jgi:putative effector of murein hydrolase
MTVPQTLLAGVSVTVLAHVLSRLVNRRLPRVALALWGMIFAVGLLGLCQWPFADYIQTVRPVFDRLLGYVTVLLAVPLATIRKSDLQPWRQTVGLLLFASVFGALLPMGLAMGLGLERAQVLAYATRSVTTPIGINIAMIIGAPEVLASMIIAFSGVVGVMVATPALKGSDDRAYGLALGLVAHAIGTVQAFYRSPLAARYAAFGMALNGIITALWLPLFVQYFVA